MTGHALVVLVLVLVAISSVCGADNALSGFIKIDNNQAMRFMSGATEVPNVLPQLSVQVNGRSTVYTFGGSGVQLTVQFTTATLTEERYIDLLSRPVTYLTFTVETTDGLPHAVKIYFDATGELTVADDSETVTWNRYTLNGLQILQLGRDQQNPLSGTNDLVDWGWLYVAVPDEPAVQQVVYGSAAARTQFRDNGTIPSVDDTRKPRAVNDDWPVLVNVFDFGVLAPAVVQSRFLVLAYDELKAIDFFGDQFLPYWRRYGEDANALLLNATVDYNTVLQLVTEADAVLAADVLRVGGSNYAELATLVFRQTFGASNMVWNDKKQVPWYFLKEISSCGCLSTVDVTFPASPAMLYTNPDHLYRQIAPIMAYANNETFVQYNLSWAPHHLGYYPIANLPVSGQENMPVEETANIILMLAGIAQRKGSVAFVQEYWSLLESWALYLNTTALDPGDQLCTDDFEGPSPHNVNLAAKGIVGLGGFSVLCQIAGKTQEAAMWLAQAQNYAKQWMINANDTNHYRLQYDLPNSWSLKYNILWQQILKISVFDPAVLVTELNYYTTVQLNPYGVPLDDRATFTKSDWESWVAAADQSSDQHYFHTIIDALYKFADTTPDRAPFTDWYETISARLKGFRCRPVMGGLFAKMLV